MLSIFYKLVVTFFGINLTILLLIFLSSENEIFTRMSIFPCSVLSTSYVDPCRYLHILTLSICPLCPTTIVSFPLLCAASLLLKLQHVSLAPLIVWMEGFVWFLFLCPCRNTVDCLLWKRSEYLYHLGCLHIRRFSSNFRTMNFVCCCDHDHTLEQIRAKFRIPCMRTHLGTCQEKKKLKQNKNEKI